MVNDLTHLCQQSPTNVVFKLEDESICFHSLILLVRSAWFRRSWRMCADTDADQALEYNFNYHGGSMLTPDECDIKICLESDLPVHLAGEMTFSLELLKQHQNKYDFLKSFEQFKLFLYRGTCEISKENAKDLLILAQAFQVDTLKTFISDYFQKVLSYDNIDGLVATAQLAHGE